MAVLIVVTGPPASGKSTLSASIGTAFSLPVLAKDALKESLADDLGLSGDEWSSRVGSASINLLFRLTGELLDSGVSLVLEGNFHPELARTAISRLATRGTLIQVVCRAAPDILLARYSKRWDDGGRHPIHRDDLQSTRPEFLAQLVRDSTIDLPGPVIPVDTTSIENLDVDAVLDQLEAAILKSGEDLRRVNRDISIRSHHPNPGPLS
jgi:predicted kinase